jgi:cell division protein FtsB
VNVLRAAGRIGLACSALAIVTVVAIQYEGIIVRNVALSRDLAATRADLAALHETKIKQLREIRRLSDPRGAIPEIHDRLRLVTSHEELIYLKGVPTAAPGNPEAAH